MNKIDVEICFGTACFVMGGAQLQDLEAQLGEKLKEHVNIIPQNCMDLCGNDMYRQAPFARIDGEILDGATVEKILLKIQQRISV